MKKGIREMAVIPAKAGMRRLTLRSCLLLARQVISNDCPCLILTAHYNGHHGVRHYAALEGIDDLFPRDGHYLAVERPQDS